MLDPQNPDYTNTPASSKRPSFGYEPADIHNSPAVTIITPFYNMGPVFYETACSVLRQSFQQWEWLIINDGSTDPAALSILDEYRHSDPRVRVLDHPSNRGLSAARNTGFDAARTQYVVQLDGDDLLEPTAIEKWFWFLPSYPEYAFVKGYSVGFGAQEYLWRHGFHWGKAFLQENLVAPICMVRREVHSAVGGYDESNRAGLEDWDFWLHCAAHGYWGATVPEYLDWYRRRPSQADRWSNWDEGERQRAFREQLRQKYPGLWEGHFPRIVPRRHMPYELVVDTLPCDNRLRKDRPRLLMILPWLTMGGADKFNLDVIEQLTGRGYEITICTTLDGPSPWYHEFARFTPDIFILHHFLRPVDYPRFLRYLIESRQIDVVLISHSTLGYQLLPYLRSRCPGVTFVDYNHIEEEYWKNGGYPRSGVGYQELLDLNIVNSHHLRDWMVARGADSSRIKVCYINVDPERWDPAQYSRAEIRRSLGVSETVPLILYAGRLCEQKRPQLFAEVMRELAQQKVELLCLVAGDGELREFLEMLIRRHRLGRRVHLLGVVSNERMRELMAAADIFFLPSKWEGIALTLFEAMSMQVVPVAADVGGQRELVTPECGFLIPQGENEVQQYVSVLKQLIESPELRATLGQAGRRRIVAHFTIDRMAERMVELLNRAQELSRVSPRPAVGQGLGLECATLAVEYTRVEKIADEFWGLGQELNAIKSSLPWRVGRRVAHSLLGRLIYRVVRIAMGKLRDAEPI